ncbi:MAG: peptidylprolyl isomerase [Candidatus Zixiibacteriota bacterium]
MSKSGIFSLLIIVVICGVAFFYFDFFNLRYSQSAEIASILSYEDGRRASGKLVEKTKSSDPIIRQKTALALGRIGDLSKTDALFDLLNDTIPEVATSAAFAIGLTGNKKYALRLFDLSLDFEPELQAECLRSLGFLTDSSMIDIIEGLSEALSHVDHRVREQAVYAVWRANAQSEIDKIAELCLNDPVRPVRVAALYSLVRMNADQYPDIYQDWIPDSEPFVRSIALRGLALPKDNKLVPMIASGLNDRDNNVVSQAISSLTSVGTPSAINYLITSYSNIDDTRLKSQLFNSLTRLENNGLVDMAHEEINTKPSDINVSASAIIYLANIEGENIIPLIDTLAITKNRFLRKNLAEALSAIGGENVKPRLNRLFGDSEPMVRASAFTALCNVDSGNVDYYIKEALADKDYVVASLAVDKIGELNKKGLLGQLMIMLNMDAKATTDLKRSITAAAGTILKNGPDSTAENLLFHCLMDKNYLVSKEAAEIFKDILDIDKSAYINLPKQNFSEWKLKSLIEDYAENPRAIVRTNKGDFEFELYFDIAPLTVANFIKVADDGFYNNLIFHRVIPNFVVQGGDPRGDGWGGAGYEIRCEYSNLSYERGTVGIATSGKDSGSSQFFVALAPLPHLESRYTVFGQVQSGLAVLDRICPNDSIYTIQIIERNK